MKDEHFEKQQKGFEKERKALAKKHPGSYMGRPKYELEKESGFTEKKENVAKKMHSSKMLPKEKVSEWKSYKQSRSHKLLKEHQKNITDKYHK